MMEFRSPNAEEEKLKVKAAAELEADRVRLLMDQPFVGAFLIRQNLVPVVDCRCETAATDGQNIFVDPVFYLNLKPGERRFLLAHEVWHTVFLHFLRRGKREKELFNMAADMEINEMLRTEKFKLPEGVLLPQKEWQGLNAEGIYDKLLKSLPPQGTPLDSHLELDDEGKPLPGDGGESGEGGESVIDPDYKVEFGSHIEDKVREKVIEAATQCEKMRGKLPAGVQQIVENFRNGKLHWKELLAQFVTSCFGGERRWLPPNRRYISSGLYLQSRRDSSLKAVLAVDTSGSTHDDLPRFAGELSNLLNTFGNYELKVICCDAEIQSVEVFSDMTPFDGKKFKFKGGGGTAFTPVFEYLKKEQSPPDLLIYLTDGYGDLPEKPIFPVMWVITPDGRNTVPWGLEAKMD